MSSKQMMDELWDNSSFTSYFCILFFVVIIIIIMLSSVRVQKPESLQLQYQLIYNKM